MSTAYDLVGLLLEMHVLNSQDFDREIRILASSISEPRAQRWMLRVARYVVQNMDLLGSEPYTPEPKAHLSGQGIHGTKHPFGPTDPENLPTNKMSKDLLTMLSGRERLGGWGELEAMPQKNPSWWQDKEPEPEASTKKVKVPWVKHTLPSGEKVDAEVPEEDWERWHSPSRQAVKEALAEAEDYSTGFHQPVWQKRIDQEFTPYTSKKAPKKALFRGPPKAENSPEWFKTKERQKEPGKVYFWEPSRNRERDLWQRLQALVEYFNYMDYARKRYANSEHSEEKADAVEAEQLFRTLEPMKNSDISGFLRILTKAQEFAAKAPQIALRHAIRKVAEHGNLSLWKITAPQALMAVSNETTQWHGGNTVSWCTKGEYHANNYLNNQGRGSMYLVRKDGDVYALLTPYAGYFTSADNRPITPQVAQELAPLFVNIPRDVIAEAPGNLADAVQMYTNRNR